MAIPLALLAMGVDAGLKKVQSDKQKQLSDRLEEEGRARPVLGLPDALQEKKNIYKNMANSSLLPAQGYYENQLGASTARANREIQNTGGSANDIIGGLTQVDANNRSQLSALAVAGKENQQQNMANYGGVLSEVSNQQNEMFDYNQNQPYQSNQLKVQSLRDASNRNLNNAISTGIDAAQIYGTGKQMDDAFGTNYYGGNGPKRVRSPRPSAPASKDAQYAYNPMFNNVNLGLPEVK